MRREGRARQGKTGMRERREKASGEFKPLVAKQAGWEDLDAHVMVRGTCFSRLLVGVVLVMMVCFRFFLCSRGEKLDTLIERYIRNGVKPSANKTSSR
jgi:hypothetical protein